MTQRWRRGCKGLWLPSRPALVRGAAPELGAMIPLGVMASQGSLAITTIFSQALSEDTTGFEDATCRVLVPLTGGSGASNQIRARFEAPASGTLQFDNLSIGKSSGTDGDTTATPLEAKFGGASGLTLSAGQSLDCDWISSFPSFNSGDLLVIIFDVHASNGNFRSVTGLGGFPPTLYVKAAADSYNSATTPAGFASFNNRVDAVNRIQVR